MMTSSTKKNPRGNPWSTHLVTDGRQDSVVVVEAQSAIQVLQVKLVWAEQNSKSNVDHLQIFAARW